MSDLIEVINIREFKRLDVRIGTIRQVELVSGSSKLLQIQVDIGDQTRQIISGIAEWYKPDELLGMQIAVLINLKPAKIFGNESNGMLLAAESGSELSLITVDKKIPNGARVT